MAKIFTQNSKNKKKTKKNKKKTKKNKKQSEAVHDQAP